MENVLIHPFGRRCAKHCWHFPRERSGYFEDALIARLWMLCAGVEICVHAAICNGIGEFDRYFPPDCFRLEPSSGFSSLQNQFRPESWHRELQSGSQTKACAAVDRNSLDMRACGES